MGGFFFVYFAIKDLTPTDLDLVRLISFIFLLDIPPKAQILVFQFNEIKLNLVTYSILLDEYLLL